MSYIVGLLGMSRAGKDEIGKTFIENGFKRYAFGDCVKEEASQIFNIPLEDLHNHNKERNRSIIIEHGEKMRKSENNYWIEKVATRINTDIKENVNVVVTDIRRISEIHYFNVLKNKYKNNVLLIEVERPLKSGGHFDYDVETLKAIMYAKFFNVIDLRIENDSDKKSLNSKIKEIIKNFNNA